MIVGPNAIDGEDSHFRVVIGDYSHCVSHTISPRAKWTMRIGKARKLSPRQT